MVGGQSEVGEMKLHEFTGALWQWVLIIGYGGAAVIAIVLLLVNLMRAAY